MPQTEKFLKATQGSIPLILSGKAFQATIKIPDLSKNDRRFWGDWGPMYRIDLKPDQFIEVIYEDLVTGEVMVEELRPDSIEMSSPALAEERTENPFYFKVFEPSQSVKFELFMDTQGQFSHASAKVLFNEYQTNYQYEEEPYEAQEAI